MTAKEGLVMVVDDDDSHREELCDALACLGFAVVAAANGLHAVKLLDKVSPDIVITDIMMPDMDGIELVVHLRERLPKVPVIAISGGDRRGYMGYLAAAGTLGAVRTHAKPVDFETLLREAAELIADNRQR